MQWLKILNLPTAQITWPIYPHLSIVKLKVPIQLKRTNVTTLNLAIPVHPYTLCKCTEN